MDALVQAAMEKVETTVKAISNYSSANHKKIVVTRAINAVDALKSALKAL